MNQLKHIILICSICLITSCVDPLPPAPIVDGWDQHPEASVYRVQSGDTIYSVAWAFGMDYQDLARYNNLSDPFNVREGQLLRMSSPQGGMKTYTEPEVYAAPSMVSAYQSEPIMANNQQRTSSQPEPIMASNQQQTSSKSVLAASTTAPVKAPVKVESTSQSTPSKKPAPAHATDNIKQLAKGQWLWPTQGKVVKGYSTASGGNRGVDIAGSVGQPVIASAPGKVVYTGSNMPGYGKLIIVKHNNNDLSAYAFNNTILVKEGQLVKAGEKIATMGKDNDGKPGLHFEVRKNGKPVNPMGYLGKA